MVNHNHDMACTEISNGPAPVQATVSFIEINIVQLNVLKIVLKIRVPFDLVLNK